MFFLAAALSVSLKPLSVSGTTPSLLSPDNEQCEESLVSFLAVLLSLHAYLLAPALVAFVLCCVRDRPGCCVAPFRSRGGCVHQFSRMGMSA